MTAQQVYDEAQAIIALINEAQQRALRIVDPLMSDALTVGLDAASAVLATTWQATGIEPEQIDADARAALDVKFAGK